MQKASSVSYGRCSSEPSPLFKGLRGAALLPNPGGLKAFHEQNRFFYHLAKKFFVEEKPWVAINVFMPSEIFFALGLVPFSLEIAASYLAGVGLEEEPLKEAYRALPFRDICSFQRCALGAYLMDYLPPPLAFVSTTHLCDGARKMYENLSRRSGRPFFLIDVPYAVNGEGIAYVAHQLRAMAQSLTELLGQPLDEEALQKALSLSNQARHYLLMANRLREHTPALIKGSQALGQVFAGFLTFGSQEALHIFQLLYDELHARQKEGLFPLQEEKLRLLWLHFKPFFRNGLLDYLESDMKCAIAFEETSHLYWEEMDLKRPWESMAIKILSNFGHGPLSRRIEVITSLLERYNCQGALCFSHWGCFQANGSLPTLSSALKKRGWPLLQIDGDCIDRTNFVEAKERAKLEEFMSALGG